jgi:hypothetical protein
MANRVLLTSRAMREMKAAKKPHFDYSVTSADATTNFNVYYATSLSTQGREVGQAVLQKCEADGKTLSGFFGLPQPRCNIIVTPLSTNHDGSGGAYHHSCIATDLYCDVQFTPTLNAAITSAFVVAEEVEVYEAIQNQGWDCGASNGEGLSRVLAESLYPGVLDSYSTAADWLDTATRPDWVTNNDNTDSDAEANGCSVLFLFWLNAVLKYDWQQICEAAAPTLAGTYQKLTGKTTAYANFRAVVDKTWPVGKASGVTVDNPF